MPLLADRLPGAVAVAAVGVGLAFRLRTIALPTETLTARYLADDYFYYLNVAHHLAAGNGSSFDGGLTLTNGYQPLFLWLLTALFALGLSKIAAIHAGLAIQAVAGAAAAALGYRMLAASGTPWAGAAVAALLSLNLFFILPSLTGFEMALALAAMMAAARAWQRGRPPLVAGLLCGVAVLARVDSLALAFAFAVILISRVRLKPEATREQVRLKPDATGEQVRLKPDATGEQVRLKPDATREQVRLKPDATGEQVRLKPDATGEQVRLKPDATAARAIVALTAGILIVAGPWLLWNWIAFGSPMPDSGVIKAHYRGVASAWDALMTAGLTLPRILLPGRVADWLGAVGQRDVAFIAALILAGAARGAMIREFRPLGIAAVGLLAAYVLLVGAGEPGALVRYLYPVWAIVAILLFAYAGRLAPHAGAGVVLVVLALHVADLATYLRWERTAPLPLTYVGVSHTLAPAAIGQLAGNERIAAFDSGALGYFSPRPVVNLDGLANHDIVQLRRSCRGLYADCLRTYLQSKGIGALAGGTAFSWTGHFPDWARWEPIYESPPLVDGSRLIIVKLP